MARDIDRQGWNEIRPQAPVCDDRVVTVRHGGVDIEADDGLVDVSVFAHEDGVDVRVFDVQLIVKGKKFTLVQRHPPFPIERWTVLFEGEL